MKVLELYQYLEEKIPRELRCDWDNDGLMCCPDPDAEVKKVLLALDVSEKTVDHAIAEGCDLILSHHPLVFRPIKALTGEQATPRKLIKLVKNGISVMSFHTRLDALAGGVNDLLAAKLGLADVTSFGVDGEMMGRVGELADTLTLAEFAAFVKDKLGALAVLYNGDKPVKRVAVLGGNGNDFIFAAKAAGADTYVSGRLGYHPMASAREDGINLVEAGHFYTEDPVLSVLSDMVKKAATDIETVIFDSNEIEVI